MFNFWTTIRFYYQNLWIYCSLLPLKSKAVTLMVTNLPGSWCQISTRRTFWKALSADNALCKMTSLCLPTLSGEIERLIRMPFCRTIGESCSKYEHPLRTFLLVKHVLCFYWTFPFTWWNKIFINFLKRERVGCTFNNQTRNKIFYRDSRPCSKTVFCMYQSCLSTIPPTIPRL